MVILIVFSIILTSVLIVFTFRIERALTHPHIWKKQGRKDSTLTVSVCIPARNESHAMTRCLESVLASDYPKLEVIVFDDSSDDDTSILIRSFAHSGVRFIPGSMLPKDWLGKNFALEILAKEASGNLIIFMDVDTHIESTTISELVSGMVSNELAMLSIIPERKDIWRASVLFSPLRYFWLLLLSRPRAPLASASLWIIRRDMLIDTLGGFKKHKNEVRPEACIASLIPATRYNYAMSNRWLGATYEKKWLSQVETSRRVLYPIFGGKWPGAIVACLVLIVLNLPFVGILSGFFQGWAEIQIMSLWFLFAFMALYGSYTARVWRGNWWVGGLMWPVVVLQESILFIYSIWGYIHHTVTWKGRLVTEPFANVSHLEIDITK